MTHCCSSDETIPDTNEPCTDFARNRWMSLCSSATVSDAIATKWWLCLSDHYSSPVRHYHTLKHIEHLLRLTDQHQLRRPLIVSMAIFFHDIIYDPRAPDNEEKSAAMFAQFADEAGFMQQHDVELVKHYVMETKRHDHQHDPLAEEDRDLDLFLDADLAILGSSSDDYDRYTVQVRKEYSHLSDAAFKSGRSAFLSKMLALLSSETGMTIFRNTDMRQRLEMPAIDNMRRELQVLRE